MNNQFNVPGLSNISGFGAGFPSQQFGAFPQSFGASFGAQPGFGAASINSFSSGLGAAQFGNLGGYGQFGQSSFPGFNQQPF